MTEFIQMLDQVDGQMLLWLNSMHAPLMDRFMMLFTGKWVWVPFYAALLYYLCRRFDPRRVLIYALSVALCITLADQTCSTLLRPIFQRMRPANLDNPLSQWVHVVDGYRGGHYGFPSCHAANTMALAMFFSLVSRQRCLVLFMYGWALLTCYTRMYLGVHYPGDLLFGTLIGSFYGWMVYYGTTFVPARGNSWIEWPRSVPPAAVPIAVATLTTVVLLIVALF